MYWRLFTSRLSITPTAPRAVVLDSAGMTYVDNDYLTMGIREGWLLRTGCFQDSRGRIVWQYVHVERPVTR